MKVLPAIYGLILSTILLGATPVAAGSKLPPTAMSLASGDRLELERMLTRELQRVVDKQQRIAGQGGHVSVKATFDPSNPTLLVNFSRSYLPKYNGAAFEDLTHELSTLVFDLTDGLVHVRGLEFRIEGKPLNRYFPDEVPPIRKRAGAQLEPDTIVAIAAGHGYYLNHEDNTWRPQRDPSNGITEDFLTPYFILDLKDALLARSAVTIANARTPSTSTHAPSGQPWWKMGARYYLQSIYPALPAMWNSLPSSTDVMRERDEDIRSRPLFANYVGADTLIHVHTNAAETSAPRGARAYVQDGRTQDLPLASSMLCYMKEQITGQASFASYPVADYPHTGNYGEMRLADMSSVVVEVGFHTNPTDAGLLQNSAFRKAAMLGVEKGYRMHREGKPCHRWALNAVANASGPQNQNIPITADFQGYPKLPVRAELKVVSCATGWNCSNSTRATTMISDTRLTYNVKCTSTTPQPDASFTVTTTLVDADGVRTKSLQHAYVCTQPATTAS